MKYRKKPVVIEAMQTDGTVETADKIREWCGLADHWIGGGKGVAFVIPTLEGSMYADPGDWIIRGVKGELYPCKPDIFEATYEPVGEEYGTP